VSADTVKTMFNSAYEAAIEDSDVNIENQYPLDIGIIETGDNAIEWAVYYYTKDIKNIIKTRQRFRLLILQQSKEENVQLATPSLYKKIEH